MKLFTIFRYTAGLSVILFIASCATSRPEWITRYPVIEGFYTGIGGSNTGDPDEDRILSKEKALLEIASQISTQLKSDIIIQEQEDSSGNSYTLVTQRLEENIGIVLQGVELVDVYCSAKDGCWSFCRLSKSLIQEKKTRLAGMIREDLSSVRQDQGISLTEAVYILGKDYRQLVDSPFIGTIALEAEEKTGSAVDIIEKEIQGMLLSIEISQEFTEEEVIIRISHSSRKTIGPFPLVIVFSQGDQIILSRDFQTDEYGKARYKFSDLSLPPGKYSVSLSGNLKWFGLLEGEGIYGTFSKPRPPAAGTSLTIGRPSIGFNLAGNINKEESFNLLLSSVKDLFPGFSLDKSGKDEKSEDLTCILTLNYRETPKNDYGLVIVYVDAVLHLQQRGEILSAFSVNSLKEGGLTKDQALSRGIEKLITYFQEHKDIGSLLLKEAGYESAEP